MREESWFRPYVRQHGWRFAIVIALSLLTVLAASSLMFTSGFLISKSALRPENILLVYVPVVLVRTFGISRAVIHYVERLASHDAILRILSKMRVRLYRMLEPQALFIRSRYRTGDVLGALADDIEYLQNVYLRTVFPTVVALVMYVAVIAVLGWFDIGFACLMGLYLFVLVFVLPGVSLRITYARHEQMKQQRSRLYRKLTDAVLGMGDWMISGRAAQFAAAYEADEQRVAAIERSLSRWARGRMFIAQCIVGLAVVSMAYWSGQQAASGSFAVTLIAAFTLVVFPLMDAFLPVSEAIEKIPQYRDSLSRLNEMRGGAGESVEGDLTAGVSFTVGQNAHIQLTNVRYRYSSSEVNAGTSASLSGLSKPSDWTLENIDLDLPQGKRVAIIGRSGAGKSTLLKLVQGALSPNEGEVLVNGIPAHRYGEQIASVVAVLNQRPHLFDTTVANNLRLGRADASDEEIAQAARQVKLDQLIASLPEGYATPMLETGQRFSGGERQRIALARVLLQNTPVVILDEPTVGLDPRTERELLQTMFLALHGKSLLWITHHLVGVEQMDEVIFIEDGRVAMRGTHEELMAREPRYAKLYRLDRPQINI
ncbi:thiol reductant ABC exporter subunit CydC [Paenibacillus guangzhouensis]|uniref:thiol reductant ABC exporter subunit CydC n=1 Tax=Paenibacillus guangzhouensis TaxID=1473112 RepID=UPI0012677A94|nr:thiol reductant ABC exporter subunit CydC [Paenibacillus guangzhouensis]